MCFRDEQISVFHHTIGVVLGFRTDVDLFEYETSLTNTLTALEAMVIDHTAENNSTSF